MDDPLGAAGGVHALDALLWLGLQGDPLVSLIQPRGGGRRPAWTVALDVLPASLLVIELAPTYGKVAGRGCTGARARCARASPAMDAWRAAGTPGPAALELTVAPSRDRTSPACRPGADGAATLVPRRAPLVAALRRGGLTAAAADPLELCARCATTHDAVAYAAHEPAIDGPEPAAARRPGRRGARRVQRQDGYGYDVVRRLRATGLAGRRRRLRVRHAARLYRGGALTSYVVPSDEGPHRRYYGITESGRTQLSEARTTWAEFARALNDLLAGDRRGGDRMTTATGLPPNVEVYLEALRAELSDLAAEEREDLLSEVEPSLLEAAADGDDPIAARLGPAADFAADLRASAGLPPAPRAQAPRPGLRAALAQLADTPRARRARAFLPSSPRSGGRRARRWRSAPSPSLLGFAWSVQWPFLPRYGSAAGTVVVALAALAASCALGLATRRGRLRRTSLAISAATLILSPFVVDAAGAPAEPLPYDASASSEPLEQAGLRFDGQPLANVFAYDREGRLLYDVRLYDDAGRPLDDDRGGGDPLRRRVLPHGRRAGRRTPTRCATSRRARSASPTRPPARRPARARHAAPQPAPQRGRRRRRPPRRPPRPSPAPAATGARPARVAERLLTPERRPRIAVVVGHRDVPGALVHPLRAGLPGTGVEARDRVAPVAPERLERVEQRAAEPAAARPGRHVHALDLACAARRAAGCRRRRARGRPPSARRTRRPAARAPPRPGPAAGRDGRVQRGDLGDHRRDDLLGDRVGPRDPPHLHLTPPAGAPARPTRPARRRGARRPP